MAMIPESTVYIPGLKMVQVGNPYPEMTAMARPQAVVVLAGSVMAKRGKDPMMGVKLQETTDPLKTATGLVLEYLQSMVPNRKQIAELVDYHERHLLWWHNCVQGSTFGLEVREALSLHPSGTLLLEKLDFRWSALLFAVLAASVASSSRSAMQVWGISRAQKRGISQKWYDAAFLCLEIGDFTARPHIHSVQAIQILGMSAHMVGSSSKQFVTYGAALRIAQSLGLHRLKRELELDDVPLGGVGPSDSPNRRSSIEREVQRRIWCHMCLHNWFSTCPADVCRIQRQHSTTSRPQRIDNATLRPAADDQILPMDFSTFLYDVASIVADFHDSNVLLEDAVEKYDQVLKYDMKLRSLATGPQAPAFIKDALPRETPVWLPVASSVAKMVYTHKILTIHRSFLGRSFHDKRFAYTRWASLEASKSLVQLGEIASSDMRRPTIWNDQAFLVGAGITLCLDLVHRDPSSSDSAHHRSLVNDILTILRQTDESALSIRGTWLLTSLLSQGGACACNGSAKKTNTFISQQERGMALTWSSDSPQGSSKGASMAPAVAGRASNSRSSAQTGDVVEDVYMIGSAEGIDQTVLQTGPGAQGGQQPFSVDRLWMSLFADHKMPADSGFENAALMEDWFGQGGV